MLTITSTVPFTFNPATPVFSVAPDIPTLTIASATATVADSSICTLVPDPTGSFAWQVVQGRTTGGETSILVSATLSDGQECQLSLDVTFPSEAVPGLTASWSATWPDASTPTPASTTASTTAQPVQTPIETPSGVAAVPGTIQLSDSPHAVATIS